jgi:hypothetical protein
VAQLSASGTGTLNWYNEAGNLLGTGTTFSTPVLTETTNFYVQALENNCTSNSVLVEVIVESCADISGLTIENSIGISPNPSNGVFEISYGLSDKEKVELEIINSAGKRIYKKRFQDGAGMNNHNINLKNVSDGIYSVILSSGNLVHSERLVIKNE